MQKRRKNRRFCYNCFIVVFCISIVVGEFSLLESTAYLLFLTSSLAASAISFAVR